MHTVDCMYLEIHSVFSELMTNYASVYASARQGEGNRKPAPDLVRFINNVIIITDSECKLPHCLNQASTLGLSYLP